MALTPEQIREAREKLGIQSEQEISPAEERIQRVRKIAEDAKRKEFTSKLKDKSYFQKIGSFLGGTAKSIAKPFAEVGVGLVNAGESVYDLARGDVQGASAALDKKRNVPLLGETKPFATGNESTGEAVKKMVGTGLEIGSTLAGAGATKSIVQAGLKGAVKQGLTQGAKTGAVTGFEAATGNALNEGETVKDSLKEGLKGGLVGGLTGGTLGAVSGGVGSRIKNVGTRAETQASKEALEIIKPELNKSAKIKALKSGKGKVTGVMGEVEVQAGRREKEIAEAVQGLVSKKNNFVENIQSVKNGITQEAEALKGFLKGNKTPVNVKEFSTGVNKIEKPVMISSDQVLDNAYNSVSKKMNELVNKNEKTLSGVLKARQEFDDYVEKQFGEKIFIDERWTPMKDAIKNIRTYTNDFIASKLPEGNNFKESLRLQNLMYEAIDNIASKEYKNVGTNKVGRFLNQHPVVKKTIPYAVPGVSGAIIGGTILRD